MEQQIRFCTTSDGVRIAYATVGEGPPLVRVLGWFTHLEYEWKTPLWRPTIEGLSASHKLVRYDGRGTGLSNRSVEGSTLEQWVSDLEAVVDAAGLQRFALLGISQGGPSAIVYALRHPERVSHLILYGSWAKWPHPQETEEDRQFFDSMLTLVRLGWRNPPTRQMFTTIFIPGASADQMRWFNEFQAASASPENAARLLEAFSKTDVSGEAARLRVPTLVLHRRDDRACPFDGGRELASLIPNARFVPLEGDNHLYLDGEEGIRDFLQAIEEFVGPGEQATDEAPAASPSGLVTILFTDMEGSTSLTQRLGDAAAQELLRTHNAIIRDALKAHGGSEIKHTGDGVMASFPGASKALECAIAIQQAFRERNASLPAHPEALEGRAEPQPSAHASTGSARADRGVSASSAGEPLLVRIGLNAGEPVAEDQDLFGTAVQLAARVCARAEPGQILAANVVRELAAGKGFLFADLGEVVLRGFEDPVRLYEVRCA
ncbi:MAG: adenylate/guanylate cyclase domain-containing protein [Dehalococcoidia bacterium]|nr:adenylate/guanylate cyclase domain-containing protein [Dehalococcoidia bacterium]